MAFKNGKKKQKGAMSAVTAAQEEAALEAALFGGGDATAGFGSERLSDAAAATPLWLDEDDAAEAAQGGAGGGAVALWEDRTGDAGPARDEEDGEEDEEGNAGGKSQRGRKRQERVWEDPDDAGLAVPVAERGRLRKLRQSEDEVALSGQQYQERLRAQHRKLNPRTRWAKPRAGDGDGAAALLEAGNVLGRPSRLPAGLLEVTPLADGNKAEPCKAAISAVDFHPGGQLLLTAGKDKRLSIFQVDGVKNPKVQSVYFQDMPVYHAAFCCGGNKIVAAGRRRHWYMVDIAAGAVTRFPRLRNVPDRSLESFAVCRDAKGQMPVAAFLGDEGRISLVSLEGGGVTGTLRMSGSARAAAFSPDGRQLLSLGGDGVVYTWDLRSQRCLSRVVDEGTLTGAALACSRDYYASGSDGGVVNLYSRHAAPGTESASGQPAAAAVAAPAKSFMNLTTTADTVAFSPDQQMLVMGSRHSKGALRAVHVPSRTVFANWPTPATPLAYVHCAAFSPGGGLLAVGTSKGRALLYRLNHYPSA